jgi:hypothetical protein
MAVQVQRRIILPVLAALTVLAMAAGPAAAFSPDTLVSVGSPTAPFSQNKQNEPAVAIDANHPDVLVAGSNDNIDMEACNAGDPTTCPFTEGVGVSGVYFSFNSGDSWVQPTYTGWTARHCVGPPGFTCTPRVGPIGTLPWYFESGLVADGDPAVAFGPRPGANGSFSWSNGSRLYYANLTSNFSAVRSEETFKGFEALAVSRTDDVQAAAAGDKNAWMRPVIASRQNAALFEDKEQIWADNAASSPLFGNVYVCSAAFRGVPGRAQTIIVARSTNGGSTWQQKQVASASNNAQHFGRSGCTVRTDSHGVVYVFYLEFGRFATQGQVGTQTMVRSFDGGVSWTRPTPVAPAVQPGVFDPVLGRPVMDGIAGFRVDLAAAPSVDIANGAPTGTDATNQIVMTWADARDGLNHEHALLTSSTNGGTSWSAPRAIEQAGDRPAYTAPGISPDGRDVYVVYNAVLTPYRDNTTAVRSLDGVVLHADVPAGGGAPGAFSLLHRGAAGDPRGSSQNNLVAEFLGDYVYAAATRTYGAVVWNDVRNAADCPAIDAWRQSLYTGASVPRPAPQQDCPATFGNTDIRGGTYPDPTP